MKSISIQFSEKIAQEFYMLQVSSIRLDGDEDENFRLKNTEGETYLLKISSKETKAPFLEFQTEILNHLEKEQFSFTLPQAIKNIDSNFVSITKIDGKTRYIRLLTWVPGRLWSLINPKTSALRHKLGKAASQLTKSLETFQHPETNRIFDWNLADSAWTINHIELFNDNQKKIVEKFQKSFTALQSSYVKLPKSSIHGDINDHNILVSEELENPSIAGFIDFGDAAHSQTINEVAILLAYACMECPDPLEASLDVLSGYKEHYSFNKNELKCLFTLVAMRWIITVTKAAIRRAEDSSNSYHTISEQAAWEALHKWNKISSEYAEYAFRDVCGFAAHTEEIAFNKWAQKNIFQFSELFPTEQIKEIHLLDLKVSSSWIGSRHQFNNLELFEYKINQLRKKYPKSLIAGGYLEPRPIYTEKEFDKEGNSGPESRTVHLGVDFWLPAQTPVHTLFDAEIITAEHTDISKQYGGLIILKHTEDGICFYTLYGHLSAESSNRFKTGDTLKKGDCIGYLGNAQENGAWSPHLHFQIMLSMLDFKTDFPGVTFPKQLSVWRSMCPNPNLLFKSKKLHTSYDATTADILHFRKKHLGKSLSVSYKEPLHIVRGDGAYLMDSYGQKYLDTVNNVAHVGHEHPKVVEAGQEQMSLLNTNTRYLNEEITKYAAALLKKLPKELSVLYFVNSGSEANELAMRMAKAATGRKDMMAIEVGYHGNTHSVIEVSSYKFDGKGGKGKPKNTHILPMPDPYRGIHKGADTGISYASYAAEILKRERSEGNEIAGFIGEPIISCGGQVVPPKNYYKAVYKHVRDAGGICIMDEVQTGFGRTGSHFWAFQLHDVMPDIVTMGKPIGNGHPLAAVACTQEVANAFANGMEFFNTFGGNPVSCAIGRSVLDVIEKEQLQENARNVGNFLKAALSTLQEQFPIIGEVRGEGLFLGFELVDENLKPLEHQATYLANRMKDCNILMSTDGPEQNVLKIKPPMVFSQENAKELIARLEQVFKEDFMSLHYNF